MTDQAFVHCDDYDTEFVCGKSVAKVSAKTEEVTCPDCIHRMLLRAKIRSSVGRKVAAIDCQAHDKDYLHYLYRSQAAGSQHVSMQLSLDDGTRLLFAGLLSVESPADQLRSAGSEWTEPTRTTATKHRIEHGGRVGFVYEYEDGRCWARMENPDRKIGSLPDLEAARAAVIAELTKI